MRLIADNALPYLTEYFSPPHFDLMALSSAQLNSKTLIKSDILLCRSVTKVNQALLGNTTVHTVASATSGIDHIDTPFLTKNDIHFICAAGCNAQAVCDYVFACIASLSADLRNKKVGVIGVGHVGKRVTKTLTHYGAKVVQNDPLRKLNEPDFVHHPLNFFYDCDVITLHTPLLSSGPNATVKLINDDFLRRLKPGCIIINAARGGVICEKSIIKYQHRFDFCLDTFINEPQVNPAVIDACKIATPHIAGHAIEAKRRSVSMIFDQLLNQTHFEKKTTPSTLSLLPLTQLPRLYSPLNETAQLKHNISASQFLALRAKHNFRHEFSIHAPLYCLS